MFEIIKVNGKYVMDEVDQSRAPQVPSFMSDPERNKMRLRRLMQSYISSAVALESAAH